MYNTPENWSVTTYTNNTWTTVLAGAAIVASVIIANTDAGSPITVAMRVGTTVIVPFTEIAAGTTYTIDVRSLAIKTGQTLGFQASAAGVHVIASGAIEGA